jgi:hypothetical protein
LVFCAGTKVFEEALNIVKFLGWFKKFGLAQNILGPEKGQGINVGNRSIVLNFYQQWPVFALKIHPRPQRPMKAKNH